LIEFNIAKKNIKELVDDWITIKEDRENNVLLLLGEGRKGKSGLAEAIAGKFGPYLWVRSLEMLKSVDVEKLFQQGKVI
jgi:hypothetical protein